MSILYLDNDVVAVDWHFGPFLAYSTSMPTPPKQQIQSVLYGRGMCSAAAHYPHLWVIRQAQLKRTIVWSYAVWLGIILMWGQCKVYYEWFLRDKQLFTM